MQKQEIEDLKIELKKYEDKTTGIEIQGSINLFFHIVKFLNLLLNYIKLYKLHLIKPWKHCGQI